jgi:hypothetical protein
MGVLWPFSALGVHGLLDEHPVVYVPVGVASICQPLRRTLRILNVGCWGPYP